MLNFGYYFLIIAARLKTNMIINKHTLVVFSFQINHISVFDRIVEYFLIKVVTTNSVSHQILIQFPKK